MPKYARILGYYVFFWSNEGRPLEPVHVHVGKSIRKNATKIWILRDGATQIESVNQEIREKDLKRIQRLIEDNAAEIVAMWEDYFKTKAIYRD